MMSHDQKKPENTFFEKIILSDQIALPNVVLTFGLGHPFDLLKTRMQANPNIYSAVLLSDDIYKKTGIKGFYTAGVPNFSRHLFKNMYRIPLRPFIENSLYQNSSEFQGKKYVVKLATGVMMSFTDNIFLCPLERIKVWMMTSYAKEKNLTSFFKEISTAPAMAPELFRGLKPSFARSVMSWTSYLLAEEKIWNVVKDLSPRVKKEDKDLPLAEKILVGGLSGLINGLFTLPFDAVKTHMQKKDFIDSEKIISVLRQIYARYGISGLYAGWQAKLINYIITGVVTSHVNREVDKIWNPPTPTPR